MKLTRPSAASPRHPRAAHPGVVDRREFLRRRSGLCAGSAALLAGTSAGMMRKTHAVEADIAPKEGVPTLCAEVCATKALLGGDGDLLADIYRERVFRCGSRSQTWG